MVSVLRSPPNHPTLKYMYLIMTSNRNRSSNLNVDGTWMIYKISISIYLHVVMIPAVVVNKSAEENKFYYCFCALITFKLYFLVPESPSLL